MLDQQSLHFLSFLRVCLLMCRSSDTEEDIGDPTALHHGFDECLQDNEHIIKKKKKTSEDSSTRSSKNDYSRRCAFGSCPRCAKSRNTQT